MPYMNVMRFVKNWALPLAMLAGAAMYFAVSAIGLSAEHKALCLQSISWLQPILIFLMLFITFSKVDLRELAFHRWHAYGLLFQASVFCALSALAWMTDGAWRIIIEGAMLCIICPTATAAAVVTQKLGGSAGGLSTYTVLINLVAALAVSSVVPLIHPQQGMTFVTDFMLIITKVMPMLLLPIVVAVVTRRYVPSIPAWLRRHPDLAFYIWCFALSLAIAVTVRSIAVSDYPLVCELGIGVVSAIACCVQFAFGRYLGGRYDEVERITAGQSLGQKNTVVIIWMGYTFLDPVTSIAGGLYSVWHNLFNSWQLYKHPTPTLPTREGAGNTL